MKTKLLFLVSILLACNPSFVFPQVQQDWEDIFSYSSNSVESTIGAGTDNAGNYYVGGGASTDAATYDFLIIKYNSLGDTLWTRLFDIDSVNTIIPVDFYVDSVGNSYMTGMSKPDTSNAWVVVTFKYNSEGVLQFYSVFDQGSTPYARSLVVDDVGNIFVLIEENGLTLIKYNPDGSEVWVKNYLNFMYPVKVIIDNNGDILAAGTKSNPNNGFQDFFLIKFNAINGDTIWTQSYDRAEYDDYLYTLVVDNQNNIFLGGTANHGQYYFTSDMAVVKYNSDGVFQWASFYNGPFDQNEELFDLITDSNGNVFAGGNYYDSLFYSTAVIIKYSSSGDSLWAATFNGDTINSPLGKIGLNKIANIADARFMGMSSGFAKSVFFDRLIIYGIAANLLSKVGTFTLVLNTNTLLFQELILHIMNNYNFFEAYVILTGLGVLSTGTAMQTSPPYSIDIVTTKYTLTASDIKNTETVPTMFSLYQNYPNPFNPSTIISYQLPIRSNVSLKVYDTLGKEVITLVSEEKTAGFYEVEFDGSKLSSGVYFYRLQVYPAKSGAGEFVQVKKLILMK